MKYIRTRTLIFELYEKEKRLYGDYISTNGIHYKYDCVIKEADTIEELCDEFVLHYDSTLQADRPIPWATYERLSDNWNACKEMLIKELNNKSGRNPIVYGAIWFDKGLKYVAKMNDKGELELL